MSLLRRRRPEAEGPEAVESVSKEVPRVDGTATPPGPTSAESQTEKALQAIVERTDKALTRLDRLEARVTDLAESVANAPSHSDVLEVRLHSAKLAAELARTTVELRGEIGMASDEARRAARLARTNDYETGEVPIVLPVDIDLVEQQPIAEVKPKKKPSTKSTRRTA